jgi:hypothetical protein
MSQKIQNSYREHDRGKNIQVSDIPRVLLVLSFVGICESVVSVVMNARMIGECWLRRDLEGSRHKLIEVPSLHLAEGTEKKKHEKSECVLAKI